MNTRYLILFRRNHRLPCHVPADARSWWINAGTLAGLLIALCANQVSAQQPAENNLAGWGRFIDADGRSEASLADGKLSITVAGGVYDLNKRNGMNAPRVVQEVEGDFEVTVKVTGDFQPGEKSALSTGLRWNSAGLLIYQNDDNYIRLERNIMSFGSTSRCFPPLCEIFSGGVYRGINKPATSEPYFQGKSTWLRMKREGDHFTASISHDGKTWETLPRVEAVLPDRVLVGTAVLNTTTSPHRVVFEDLKLTRN